MKATLVTGASSGIGEAFARKLAEKNHDLFLVARDEVKLEVICEELMSRHEIKASYIALDLNADLADETLFSETEKRGVEIDWLINNAGFGSMGDFSSLKREKELNMIDLNVKALVALTHRYLNQMRKRKSGTIINVSSTASFQPIPFMATYGATKAFVTSFSEALAEENRLYGIKVLALCPGPTKTNFFDAAGITDPIKIKGMQTAEEVVEAALKAIEKGKTSVVSGWANYFMSQAGKLAPTWLVVRSVGSVLRQKIKKENKKNNEN